MGSRSVERRLLFSQDRPEEVIGTRVDGAVAVFVLGRNAVGFAIELAFETRFDVIEEGLFGRRERCIVLPCEDELLCIAGGLSERLEIGKFLSDRRVVLVVARFGGNISFQPANLGDVSFVIPEVLLALDKTVLGVRTDDFPDVRGVEYFSHNGTCYAKGCTRRVFGYALDMLARVLEY